MNSNKISNVQLKANDEPLNYYFAEARDIKDIRNAERRRDLPEGKLRPGETFLFNGHSSSKSGDPLCILARNTDGELLGAACNADGAILNVPNSVKKKIPPKVEKKRTIRTLVDIKPKEDYIVRHVFQDNQKPLPTSSARKSSYLIFIFYVILFLLIFFLIRSILRKKNDTTLPSLE